MSKTKKGLIIAGLVVDVGLTIFFFVISIIMIVKTSSKQFDDPNTLIGYLQTHTTVYLVGFVVPLFVLLALNIVLLVLYVKKSNKKEPVTVNDLSQDQLDSLKQELLNDLVEKKDNKKE